MNKILATSAMLAALTATSVAQAQSMPSGWYVSVFAGASEIGSVDTNYNGSTLVEQHFDTSYTLGLTVGTHLTPNTRAEIELSYSSYEGGDVHYNGSFVFPSTGPVSTTYLLANAWYDFGAVSLGSGSFTPYVGGGVGGVFLSADTYFNNSIYGYGDNVFGLAAQLGGGVQVSLGSGALDIGYRFKGASGLDIDDNDGSGVYENGRFTTHNVQVGYVISF